jgi:molybdopterin converting factor small subunit
VGIEFEFEDDENFGSVQGEIVSIADETKDDVLDELQVLYDKLQEELERILEQNGDGLMMNAAGMQTQLKDGTMCTLSWFLYWQYAQSLPLFLANHLLIQVAS